MNSIKQLTGAIFIFCLLLHCSMRGQTPTGLVDIRPEEIMNMGDGNPTGISDGEQKGRQLLHESSDAHGWIKGKSSVISAKYIDDWSMAPEPLQVFNNWPHLKQELQHDFLSFQLGYSKVRLLNGPAQGEIWGIDNNIPYKVIAGEVSTVDDPNMIPALVGKEYFIQLPHWIQKVPITVYVKDAVLHNKTYHLVFGTWKSLEANAEFDQYIFWINKKTKLLEIVQYTVRVVDFNAVGFVTFDDFREIDGTVVPFVHRLGYLPTPEGLIHEMRFESIVMDPKGLSTQDIRILDVNE